ncbi:MAG: GTP-binding protein [Acidobacteria bacterium]|nr:GTP-binding protein [Acidobacteriota bacterium]
MVFFNYSTMQMVIKVVYYGPGLCGKTTNLEYIYSKTSSNSRGEMVSLETETDRTLFFDLLPIDVGVIGGFKTRFQLYTVPGQVFYNSTRKLVLKGVDGIIFVADSQIPMLDANLDSYENMKENLRELDVDVHSIPVVLQYNKRDLKNIVSVEELNKKLNVDGLPFVESSAINGTGVFETLKLASKHTLLSVKKKMAAPQKEKPAPAPAPVTLTESSSPAPESETALPVKKEIQEDVKAPIREISAAYLQNGSGNDAKIVPIDTRSDNPDPDPEPKTKPQHSHDAPKLTLDDLLDEPTTPTKSRKIKTSMQVDDLLSGLIPSKQTFIKKMHFSYKPGEFKKISRANIIIEFKDESGDVIDMQQFTTQLHKKNSTRNALMKLLIDLES